jgi:penicillin-binding protein 2
MPSDKYMKATHGRKILNGDIANMSIGQGDLLSTPLQMAQSMAIVANGGTFYQTRLVEQVQTVSNEIVAAYSVRAKKTVNASSIAMGQIHTAMVDAVNAPAGTAHQSSLDKGSVAGKTWTAQWGPKEKERTAACFRFVPAGLQYAFGAAEGDVGKDAGGSGYIMIRIPADLRV